MDRGPRAFLKDREGSVILETAMMLTVLLILVFGMVDFGRLMYTSNNLISAAREGSRFAAVQPCPITKSTVKSLVESRFNNYTFGGDNLVDANVTVNDRCLSNPPSVQVVIAYKFTWISPVASIASIIAHGTVTYKDSLHAQAEYRYEAP